MAYAVSISNGAHTLLRYSNGAYTEVAWNFEVAKQAMIDLGSQYMWHQIFPGVAVPQEIIDAEAAALPQPEE